MEEGPEMTSAQIVEVVLRMLKGANLTPKEAAEIRAFVDQNTVPAKRERFWDAIDKRLDKWHDR